MDIVCYSISMISPGLQSKTLHIASSVSNLTPFALPVFKIDRLTIVSPTFSDNCVNDIFRLANITSKLITIGISLNKRVVFLLYIYRRFEHQTECQKCQSDKSFRGNKSDPFLQRIS